MSDAPTPGRDSVVTLREVSGETVRQICGLKVRDTQTDMVSPNAVSIAQAYFDRDHAWFRAVYADETPVGFVMIYDNPEIREYILWRFMIDERYQGLGYGRRAMDIIIELARNRPDVTAIQLSCHLDEHGPQGFYLKFGFALTGETWVDQHVMKLELTPGTRGGI